MFYIGMDVAKAKRDCCLLLDEAGGKRKAQVVNNTKPGLVDFHFAPHSSAWQPPMPGYFSFPARGER